jgi:hypothetical protein
MISKEDCWHWFAAVRAGGGYGQIRLNGKTHGAHRYYYEKYNGPIPKGALVLHKCDNMACVNPDHLYLGDHYDNARDRVSKTLND